LVAGQGASSRWWASSSVQYIYLSYFYDYVISYLSVLVPTKVVFLLRLLLIFTNIVELCCNCQKFNRL
ncbi:MAG TPA: hypothetical protein PK037_10965, partial [Saprospiraceae bacterium]|nr:hypothetical protein [Saprospiraceae bacterium]